MLKLCGFAASNYYNKVKLALLEKGLPFEEELAWVGEVDLAASPLTERRNLLCMPLQQPLATIKPGEWWAPMEGVFHLD